MTKEIKDEKSINYKVEIYNETQRDLTKEAPSRDLLESIYGPNLNNKVVTEEEMERMSPCSFDPNARYMNEYFSSFVDIFGIRKSGLGKIYERMKVPFKIEPNEERNLYWKEILARREAEKK